MIRTPAVSGQFYESDFGKLHKQIESCFLSRFGPGDLPGKRRSKRVYGFIVPHAGYQFSGPCAAWAYKEMGESMFLQTYLIIGTNHTGYSESKIGTLDQDWETSFGVVKCDRERIKKIVSESKHIIRIDPKSHFNEHSIEVQLPFLQFVNKDNLRDLKIVPLIVNELSNIEAISSILAEEFKNALVICSSDFTHYGVNYNYLPFSASKEKLYALDKEAIKFILELDSSGFLSYSSGKTICGVYGIVLFIEVMKKMGASRGRVLRYYTSGDLTNNYSNAVGYGSIVFE